MKRSLAMAALALGLIALGCDDSPGNPDAPVAGSGGRGGTGGTGGTGGGGTGGTGGGTGGTGGVKMDAKGPDTGGGDKPKVADGPGGDKPADTGADTATDTGGSANICASYTAGSGQLANISADSFCTEYATTCGFTGTNHYTSRDNCVTVYGALTGNTAMGVDQKTCRAGHLCNAKTIAGGADTHCPHAFGTGPCAP